MRNPVIVSIAALALATTIFAQIAAAPTVIRSVNGRRNSSRSHPKERWNSKPANREKDPEPGSLPQETIRLVTQTFRACFARWSTPDRFNSFTLRTRSCNFSNGPGFGAKSGPRDGKCPKIPVPDFTDIPLEDGKAT